ncbi:hypothetical protein D3C87_2035520 [compost metagenome]
MFLMRRPGFRAPPRTAPKAEGGADEGTEFARRDQSGRGILDGFEDHELARDFPAILYSIVQAELLFKLLHRVRA